MKVPDRGDFIYLDFYPQTGTEQSGRRPPIVLSPAKFNRVTGYATVCPISGTKREWGFNIHIPEGFAVEGVIISDQVKNLDWKTKNAKITGKAPNDLVNKVVQVIHTYIYEE
ncbi:type II toxin-antitoxin system PemK/MazF family toxin [Allobacillus sp. GCM10007491]|uniref:Type II toxin-antitoxin system PemK/MazF family toxin n=1 Tax=Allobacillus saliphilus TaxID=2912308 RepID=A0A941HSE1_9BACI|nr:type II toxin-antitoxin system PemK/MazF family toxin [Allobacillus saliphilus]MBR7553616.1 type II toxin-antitoxin system PemK/MazF family toxin [Allobacillus saliphilus]